MNLGKQIGSLLIKNTAVYVKGLGVFRRIRTAATFDSNNNVYLPPISFIAFDADSTDGFDFVSYLQQVERIDRQEAEEKLDDSISRIIKEVQQRGFYVLDSLGSLVSFGTTFVFKPYDLTGFEYSAVENDSKFHHREGEVVNDDEGEDNKGVIEQVEKNETSLEEDVESQQQNDVVSKEDKIVEIAEKSPEETVEITENYDEQSEKKDSNSYIYGLIAAVAILALGAVYYYMAYYKATPVVTAINSNNAMLNTLDTTAIDTSLNTAVLLDDSVTNALVDQEGNEELEMDNTEEMLDAAVVDHKFVIIIGTHLTIEEAQDEAEMYHNKGYTNVRVLLPNLSKNRKRVIWDSYQTRQERDSVLRIVRKNIKEDAWGTEI